MSCSKTYNKPEHVAIDNKDDVNVDDDDDRNNTIIMQTFSLVNK